MKIKAKLLSVFLVISTVVASAGIFSVFQLTYLYEISRDIGLKNAPLADAAMEIKFQSTTAHLLFEEILSGNEDKKLIATVWALFDETDWYCDAILKGGKNSENTFYPVNDESIESKIQHVKMGLQNLRAMAQLRYDHFLNTQKTESQYFDMEKHFDIQFDATFKKFITETDEAETMLMNKIANNFTHMEKIVYKEKNFLIFITLLSFIFIALPLYYVSRDILLEVGGEPADIAKITEKVAAGNLDLQFDDKKQTTGIYASIKRMVRNLNRINAERESQSWLKNGQMELSKIMTGEQDISVLAKNIISFLTTYVDAQVGLFYLAVESDSDKGDIVLQRVADYAYIKNPHIPAQFDMGDSLVGQVALEKKVIFHTHTSTERTPVIQSGLALASINQVILLPFLYNTQVRGVVEIGTAKTLTTVQRNFLQQIMPDIGIAINGAESRHKMHSLVQQIENTSKHVEITLNVGFLPILDHLTLLVSHIWDSSIFRKVKIQPKKFNSWNSMSAALEKGSINAAFILSPLAMKLFSQNVDIKTILLAHRDGSAITVRHDSGIHTIADFKGKRIAIPHRISTHAALLNHYLRQGGISLKDVTTEVIAPVDMIVAMQKNEIDAFIVAEPFGSKAQNEGIGKILILTKDIINHHVECIVVVKREILDNYPEAIQEWVNSLIRVGKFIDTDKLYNNSKAIAQMMANRYWHHSEKTIIAGLQNPTHRISFSDLNPTLMDFETIMNTAQQAGIIEKINLSTFIDKRFYEKSLKIL